MEKLYYSIGETAEILQENVSAVRFWTKQFAQYVKPHRNGKGNRLFTAADIETLKQVKHLVKVEGLTLDGATRAMAGNRSKLDTKVKALESLKAIRAQLVEIKESL